MCGCREGALLRMAPLEDLIYERRNESLQTVNFRLCLCPEAAEREGTTQSCHHFLPSDESPWILGPEPRNGKKVEGKNGTIQSQHTVITQLSVPGTRQIHVRHSGQKAFFPLSSSRSLWSWHLPHCPTELTHSQRLEPSRKFTAGP